MESKDIKVLEELAGNGDVGALCKLGELYLTGNGGVGVDLNKARGLFEAASAKGSNGANYNLGKMYYNGTGVGTNHAKAKEYFEKASSADNVFAKYYLGKLYYWGDGVEKDYNKANEYKVTILNKPIYASQKAGLEEFYSLTEFEGVTKDYVGEIQEKVFQEYKGLYGKE